MATAVLQVELTRLPAGVELDARYERAFVLFRWHGHPVGQATLALEAGRLSGVRLWEAASSRAGAAVRARALRRFLQREEGTEPGAGADRGPATIAVCTRDRPADLARCLAALDALPDDGQEVLVVDSASADPAGIRALVAGCRRARCLRVERPGLDVARNVALREARHDVVAFTDDDAAPDPGWLRALLPAFDDPRTLCVTGMTLPAELETPAQECFERTNGFGRGFARTLHDGARVNPFQAARVGAGVNMALRRSLLDLVGPFDEALDAGTRTRSGGDHEMFMRILAAGYCIAYEPAALSWHRHRRGWAELRATVHGYGTGAVAALTRHALQGESGAVVLALRWLAWQLFDMVRGGAGRRDALPFDLAFAQLSGCLAGPAAYLAARRALGPAHPGTPSPEAAPAATATAPSVAAAMSGSAT